MPEITHFHHDDARACHDSQGSNARAMRAPTCEQCKRRAAILALADDENAAGLIANGLRIAANKYAEYAQNSNAWGEKPEAVARLTEQFERQRVETLALIALIEP